MSIEEETGTEQEQREPVTPAKSEAPEQKVPERVIERSVGESIEGESSEPPRTDDSVLEEHNKQVQEETVVDEEAKAREEIEKAQKELEALDPETNAVRWIIGKPPEHGGKEKEYAAYIQERLPWIPRQKFFSLVARTMSSAVRDSGGTIGGMSDILNDEDGGTAIERGRRWVQKDFGDVASFMTLLFELIGHSPKFTIEAYKIWLNVPRGDREWAEHHFSIPWNPAQSQWGLKDEDHEKIVNTFIDQNYEEIRRFLTEVLPSIMKRMALHERSRERKGLLPESGSGRSIL